MVSSISRIGSDRLMIGLCVAVFVFLSVAVLIVIEYLLVAIWMRESGN